MRFPEHKPKPDFRLLETRPPVPALGKDNTATTHDLVEQMRYLYVNVVKARELTGRLHPYVEVNISSYRGVTKKNQLPVWNQVFAFSKDRLQSSMMLQVVVKNNDDFVGRVVFYMIEVPFRDNPLAPEWYKLEDKKGAKVAGEIMLAVWMGTQADQAFSGAWNSDAPGVSGHSLTNTRSKVYFSPNLYYLRIHVIEAQDLIPSCRSRLREFYVKIQLGNQGRNTRASLSQNINPIWNQELMLVASEPFDDLVIISVRDRIGPGHHEPVGRMSVPVKDIQQRIDSTELLESRWFNLGPGEDDQEEGEDTKEIKFSSKIHLRLCLEAGYHVLDESTYFSSDLQPSSTHLRKPSIGILELGIIDARNLLPTMGQTTDAYCVAKYGNKWVRTRTILDTLTPRWNEQYTWEVYDSCTVITVGVFYNGHINETENSKDERIGKVRIRLSTLETNHVYTHRYPLLVLYPSGLKKHGELHLAVRFRCVAWLNMVAQYSRPLLPKMHHVQPISVEDIDWLRPQAVQIVAARLSQATPPLKRETIEYMLKLDHLTWSLRRSKVNFFRIMALLTRTIVVLQWLDEIRQWKKPLASILIHVLFLMLLCYPALILPTIFLYLFVIGLWNYRLRPQHPPHIDAILSHTEDVHPDELDEEFDSFPASRAKDVIRMRYDRLRSIGGRIQTVMGDLGTMGEKAAALLSWRDYRATEVFIAMALVWAVVLYVTPFKVVVGFLGFYWLRHSVFRSRTPSVPVNFFKRLPSEYEMLL